MGMIGVIAFERFASGKRAQKSLNTIVNCIDEAEKYVGDIKLLVLRKTGESAVPWAGLPRTIHKAMRSEPNISQWMIMSLDAMYNSGRYNPILLCYAAAKNSGDEKGIVHTAFVREVDGAARGIFQGILSMEDIRRYDPFGSCIYLFGKKVFVDSGNDLAKLSMRRMLWNLLSEMPLIFVPHCTHIEQLTYKEEHELHKDSARITTLIGLPRIMAVVIDRSGSVGATEMVKLVTQLTEYFGYGQYLEFALCCEEKNAMVNSDADRLFVRDIYEGSNNSFEEMLALAISGSASREYSYVVVVDAGAVNKLKRKLNLVGNVIEDVVLEERDGVLTVRKLAEGVWMFPQRLAEALDLKDKKFEDAIILYAKSKGMVIKNGQD